MISSGEDNMRHFSEYPQTVEFTGQEDQHSVEIYSEDVTVIPSPGGHNHGSSKVILKNIVDFTWEHRYYTGQLLAIHKSGKYLAYGIKTGNAGPAVRVVNKQTEHRKLLKGMRVAIQDLAFAYVPNVILACIDYSGSLFVHTIEDISTELVCTRILQVDADDPSPTSHRVIWCPYVPDEDAIEGDDVSKFLILTRGSQVELWSVAGASKLFSSPINATDPQVKETGVMMEIKEHSGTIVEAAFSPDGTAVATASLDGVIKFFQVHMQGGPNRTSTAKQQQPHCLHEWKPHGGRPISCLFFLDDHKNTQPDEQFWRFAITGCDQNSELKLWSCEMWKCLQTIKFSPSLSSGKLPVLKAGLDLSAGYLLLSDIYNKVLYILCLTKDSEDAVACVSTISELLLPYPILSFVVVDAGQCKMRAPGDTFLEDEVDEEEEQLMLRMFLVQPKSLQECHIAFRPAAQVSARHLMDNLVDKYDLSLNFSNEESSIKQNGVAVETNGEPNHSGLNLMTPDAFSSPAKKENNALNSNPESPTILNPETPLTKVALEEQAPPSGGSSPSREVCEILSLAKPEDIEAALKPEQAKQENWSDIPMVLLKDVHTMQGSEKIVEDGDEETKDEEPAAKIEPQTTVLAVDRKSEWNATNDNIFILRNKIDALFKLVQEQRQEISDLRDDVTQLRQETTPIASQVENAVLRVSQQQNANLEQTFYSHITRQRELLNVAETTFKEKIEAHIPGVMNSFLEPFMARIDEVLQENLVKLLTGTKVRDALAVAAVNAAKVSLDAAFKETFANVVLPGMEKACQNMFRQIEDAFVRGTKQYLQNADTVIEKQCQRRNEEHSEILAAVVREEMQNELSKGLSVMQEATMRTVRDSFRDNFSQHLSEFSGARSRATTPGLNVTSSADAQSRVVSLLQRGQLNAAFQQALSASDLDLVVLVCEKTEPSHVFSCPVPSGHGTRCILAQPVILSLVQQLSADLGHRTELKHKWLEEAILNLDPNDPVTREHMSNVLLPLQNQLAAFVSANPTHRSVRRMKMLAMAARAFLGHR